MEKFVYRQGPSMRCSIGSRELHCGDTFTLHTTEGEIYVRVEMHNDDWYLIGIGFGHAANWSGTPAKF